MKAITIFSTQYGLLNSYEDKFRTCDATDYVFVPEVYDPTASTGNLNGVKYSVEGNAVKYRDGVKVIASKVSTTQIGYEMEYDPYKPNAETLYGEYVSTFSSLKSKPTVFYWAGSDSSGITKSFDKINSFY